MSGREKSVSLSPDSPPMIEQGLRQYDPSEAEELVSGTTTLGTGTPEGRDVGSDELAGESERLRSIAVPSNAINQQTIIKYPVLIIRYRNTSTRKTSSELVDDQTRISGKNKLSEKTRDPGQTSVNNNEQTTIRKETEESDVVHNRLIDHYNRPGPSSAIDPHQLFECNENRKDSDLFRQLQKCYNLLYTELEKLHKEKIETDRVNRMKIMEVENKCNELAKANRKRTHEQTNDIFREIIGRKEIESTQKKQRKTQSTQTDDEIVRQISELIAENTELRKKLVERTTLCTICADREACFINIPCLHLAYCEQCRAEAIELFRTSADSDEFANFDNLNPILIPIDGTTILKLMPRASRECAMYRGLVHSTLKFF